MKLVKLLLIGSLGCIILGAMYPYDAYDKTGIKRLKYLEQVKTGAVKSNSIKPGALLPLSAIKLNLTSCNMERAGAMPKVNSALQQEISKLFKGKDKNYALTVLNMSDLDNIQYAEHRSSAQFQPGSVGKLVVLAAFFDALKEVYPKQFNKRIALLKHKQITAGNWALHDHHTVPVYNMDTKTLRKRKVVSKDVFSLYEWLDHMVSVSNNGAASVVWREALLMQVFKKDYPDLSFEDAEAFFKSKTKSELSEMAITMVNAPLRDLGITEEEFRLGKFFTSGAGAYIPGRGGSIGTPMGLMKYVIALEEGKIVDKNTSLEMKRLLYLTDRRIRYAASKTLDSAAVYFKSGSFYKCNKQKNPSCGDYEGNVYNYMNSVIIVEHPNGMKYAVCLMTNVLGKNSAYDHLMLASKIDGIVKASI